MEHGGGKGALGRAEPERGKICPNFKFSKKQAFLTRQTIKKVVCREHVFCWWLERHKAGVGSWSPLESTTVHCGRSLCLLACVRLTS